MYKKFNNVPKTWTDRLACFVTAILIPLYYVFEMFYVLPSLYVEHGRTASFYYHNVAAVVLTVNIAASFILVIVTDNTSGTTVLPSVTPPKWRYCVVCEANAPPRSYHCRTCDKCILKRDHHCTFTGNCIGLRNHRYFLSFLFNIAVGGVYMTAINGLYIRDNIPEFSFSTVVGLIFPIFAAILGLEIHIDVGTAFLMSLGLFGTALIAALLVYQVSNAARGQVGDERWRKITHYDLGVAENLRLAMGRRWLAALVSPFVHSPLECDGITYRDNSAGSGKCR